MTRLLSRRQLLAGAAGLGATAATGGLLAACGRTTQGPSVGPSIPGTSAVPSGSPAVAPSASPPSVPPRRRDHPVERENRLPGSGDWDQGRSGAPGAQGYLDHTSVGPGERFALHLGGSGPVDVEWYRLGWYGGAGGRLVRVDRGVSTVPPAHPDPSPDTGLVQAGWPPALELQPGGDWTSGVYVAVLRPAAGRAGYVPFVVRPAVGTAMPGGPAPVLFVNAAATWQAYNAWGGKSLYGYNSSGALTPSGTTAAVTVSMDRPHLLDRGAGFLFHWELQFVRWQEREARDVEYISDVDLALHPELLSGRQMLVFAGHPEYWSRGMRQALETAIAGGTNVAFLTANEVYWAIRWSDSPLGPARRITCYRVADRDPMTAIDPSEATCRWREQPLNEPEAAVVGQMYGRIVRRPADWVVQNSDHWLYAGTGLRDGDRITNLVGQEFDTFSPEFAPPGTIILALGLVDAAGVDPNETEGVPGPAIHTATIYTADSGATVVAAGTFQWSWAIDTFGARAWHGYPTPADTRVEVMTRNLFDRLGDGLTG